ncbi:hypothetical protein AeMF1_021037 [Aphanomyces euteiches]|nr:hypothetical protein AeMF1_021037 [Aphanomyces euteiches]KAH9184737.1 hypothetical protein AeNC1_013285 [Aphanomyces euteiches]
MEEELALESLQHHLEAIALMEKKDLEMGMKPVVLPNDATAGDDLPSMRKDELHAGNTSATFASQPSTKYVQKQQVVHALESVRAPEYASQDDLRPRNDEGNASLERAHEADVFATMVKTHCESLLQSSMTLFHDMEVRLTSDRKTIEQALQEDHAQRQSDLEKALAVQQKAVNDKSMRVKKLKVFLMRLAELVSSKATDHNHRRLLSRSFLAWQNYRRKRLFKALRWRQALVFCSQKPPRRPFLAWARYVLDARQTRQLDQLGSAQAEAFVTLQNQHEIELESLRQQLAQAHGEIEVYRLEQVRLEEDVRRVFLRGVSAMNLEALSLFRNHASSSSSTVSSTAVTSMPPSSRDAMEDLELPRSSIPQPFHKA